MEQNKSDFGARVVIKLENEFAKAINQRGLHYIRDKRLEPLKRVLEEHHADLHNAMRDFEYYVQSSEAHGVYDSPIVNWTRDATINPHSRARYNTMFTVGIAGQKVFDQETVEKIKADFEVLSGDGVIELVKIDSMDPQTNPSIPPRYFGEAVPSLEQA